MTPAQPTNSEFAATRLKEFQTKKDELLRQREQLTRMIDVYDGAIQDAEFWITHFKAQETAPVGDMNA